LKLFIKPPEDGDDDSNEFDGKVLDRSYQNIIRKEYGTNGIFKW